MATAMGLFLRVCEKNYIIIFMKKYIYRIICSLAICMILVACGQTKKENSKEEFIPTVVSTETEIDMNSEVVTEIPEETEPQELATHLICIDAGHQRKGNNAKEPLGPGSSQTKKKVSYGTRGNASGLGEYELTLAIALQLEEELKSRGYEVLMIRTTHDVNISNAERSEIANEAKADAFIRIHANGSENTSQTGAFTICMTSKNPFNSQLHDISYKLADCVLDGYVEATGCKRRDIWQTDTMTGINWSKVPVTIIEMGYMTNATEDLNMANPEYQKKMVLGIANGIDLFFTE